MGPEAEKLGAELPAGVQGTMDGEKPPLSQVEELRKAIEPFKLKRLALLECVWPLRGTATTSRSSGPGGSSSDCRAPEMKRELAVEVQARGRHSEAPAGEPLAREPREMVPRGCFQMLSGIFRSTMPWSSCYRWCWPSSRTPSACRLAGRTVCYG